MCALLPEAAPVIVLVTGPQHSHLIVDNETVPRLVTAFLPAGSLAAHSQPTLMVDELVSRPWLPNDLPAVMAAYDDPAIQQWHSKTMTQDEAAAWIAHWPQRWNQETGAGWAITHNDEVLGQVSLRSIDLAEASVELSYWVLPAGRERSIAPRVVRELTRWLFEATGVHRAELAHSTHNTASCRVAVKAGYLLEGTKRQEALHVDGWHDMHLHARLRTDEARPSSG